MRAVRGSALWPAFILLAGCGGARPVSDAPVGFEVESTSGGAYVAGCVEGDEVVAARAYRLERWRLPADGPPALVSRAPVGRAGVDPPVVSVACGAGGRVVAGLADGGEAVGVEGDAVVWRQAGGVPPGWPAVAARPADPGPHRWRALLPGGREAVLGDWGRGTLREGAFVEWRPAAGGLVEAAFDGRVVWAVGPSGLWRWRPGPGEPMAVPLPVALAGRTLVDAFRDGPLLWVRTADDEGWALDVSGPSARPVAEPGRLAPRAEGPLRAPAGPVLAEAPPGARHLRLVRREDALAIGLVELPGPLHALLPLTLGADALLLVAAGDEVQLMRFGADGEARVAARLRFWSPTVRLFAHGDRVLLVGPRYGFGVLRLRPGG